MPESDYHSSDRLMPVAFVRRTVQTLLIHEGGWIPRTAVHVSLHRTAAVEANYTIQTEPPTSGWLRIQKRADGLLTLWLRPDTEPFTPEPMPSRPLVVVGQVLIEEPPAPTGPRGRSLPDPDGQP